MIAKTSASGTGLLPARGAIADGFAISAETLPLQSITLNY
jgi:hypothetical protein